MNEVKSLADVRANIDRLDRQIIPLLAERGQYVMAAARFKKDAAEVPAPATSAALPRSRARFRTSSRRRTGR